MNSNKNNMIWIADSLEEGPQNAFRERGLGGSAGKSPVKAVGVHELKENVKIFFSQLDEILITGSDKVGAFSVDQVEISAQITAEGKVCLLGSGTKAGVSGGLKFILKRTP